MTGWDGLQSDSERFSAGQPRPLWLTAIWGKLDDLIWSKCISTHKPWDFYWVCPKFSGQLVVFEDLTALETAKEVAEQTQQFALAEAIDRELVAKWLEGPATDETHPETAGEKPNILDLFKRFKPSFNSFYGWYHKSWGIRYTMVHRFLGKSNYQGLQAFGTDVTLLWASFWSHLDHPNDIGPLVPHWYPMSPFHHRTDQWLGRLWDLLPCNRIIWRSWLTAPDAGGSDQMAGHPLRSNRNPVHLHRNLRFL